jgi:hypothetical protein
MLHMPWTDQLNTCNLQIKLAGQLDCSETSYDSIPWHTLNHVPLLCRSQPLTLITYSDAKWAGNHDDFTHLHAYMLMFFYSFFYRRRVSLCCLSRRWNHMANQSPPIVTSSPFIATSSTLWYHRWYLPMRNSYFSFKNETSGSWFPFCMGKGVYWLSPSRTCLHIQ